MARLSIVVVVAGATLCLALAVGAAVAPISSAHPASISIGAGASTSSTSSSTTTTVARPPCQFLAPAVVAHTPTTITLTLDSGGGRFDVPVGTTFNVHLQSDNCGPPEWQAPNAEPSSVLRAVPGSDLTSGEIATGNFVVVGPGDATIIAPASCVGLAIGACAAIVWRVDIHAESVAVPNSLPRTT